MADLFSADWMNRFQEEWNKEPELVDTLGKINFNSTIAYGFDGESAPRGVLVVEQGRVVKSGAYNGETMNWDLRATQENWEKWIAKGVGMMGSTLPPIGLVCVGNRNKPNFPRSSPP
ncbi:hypothetical protein, partial [Candidatus Magnetaquicoccus inordinatus]|uniref:hypothetical protein n=1 Tax=Candidatus Magnetaquicoccus inordinatus TaxID=2496818 RepID=UPI00102CCFF7